MLGSYKVRRLAALLAVASVTNAAGFLAAQAPVPSGGGATPARISDCEFVEGNCGGDQTIPSPGAGGAAPGGWDGGGGGCGSGSRVFCRSDSTWKCLKWVPLQTSGGGGAGGINGSTTMVCGESISSVVTLYWP